MLLTACNLSYFVGVRFPLCAFHLLRHLISVILATLHLVHLWVSDVEHLMME